MRTTICKLRNAAIQTGRSDFTFQVATHYKTIITPELPYDIGVKVSPESIGFGHKNIHIALMTYQNVQDMEFDQSGSVISRSENSQEVGTFFVQDQKLCVDMKLEKHQTTSGCYLLRSTAGALIFTSEMNSFSGKLVE